MKKYTNTNLLTRARKVIGDIELIDRAVEEMGELTVALIHHRRGRCGDKEVQEEIADVMIAMRQLEVIFGEFETEDIKLQKIIKFEKEIVERENYK